MFGDILLYNKEKDKYNFCPIDKLPLIDLRKFHPIAMSIDDYSNKKFIELEEPRIDGLGYSSWQKAIHHYRYSQFHLPSIEEWKSFFNNGGAYKFNECINKIRLRFLSIGCPIFNFSLYWSSTENGTTHAWYVDATSHNINTFSKDTVLHVRGFLNL